MRSSPALISGLLALALVTTVGCPNFDKQAVENTRPLVSAGEDQSATGGDVVTLSATGTDADSDELTYFWRQTMGPGVALSAATEREVTFTAPEENASLVFEVRASDDFDESPPDLVQVNVRFNRPPVAEPGENYSTPTGTPLRLRGDATDPDGDAIASWLWTVVSGPPGVSLAGLIQEHTTRIPTFTPNVKGDYWVELIVGDGQAQSAPVEALVIAENQAPFAVPTATVSAFDSKVFDLDASASTDPDGDAITGWRWRIAGVPSGGSATLTGAPDQETNVLEVSGRGNFEIELVVTDADGGASAPAIVRVLANEAPLLSLNGQVFTAGAGNPFPVSAAASVDPDGDPLIVTWTRQTGSLLFPDQAVGQTPTIIAPSYSALLAASEDTWATYEVIATDGVLDSAPQTVTLYAGPGLTEYVW